MAGFEIRHSYPYTVIVIDDPNVRNYTMTGLHPRRRYSFRVTVVSLNGAESARSERAYLWTLPPGKQAIPMACGIAIILSVLYFQLPAHLSMSQQHLLELSWLKFDG